MLKRLWKSYGHFTLFLVFVALNMIFNWLTRTMVPKYQIASTLDRYIPFLKGFILPYLLWFIYIVIAPVYLGIKSQKRFINFGTFVVIGQIICMLVYFLYPNGQNLRPNVISNDIFSRAILAAYRSNPFTYAAPSIHVLYSLAAHIGLMKYKPFARKKVLPKLSLLFILLSILSTLFIKQHAVLDILLGLLLCAMLYLLVYKVMPKRRKTYNAINTL